MPIFQVVSSYSFQNIDAYGGGVANAGAEI